MPAVFVTIKITQGVRQPKGFQRCYIMQPMWLKPFVKVVKPKAGKTVLTRTSCHPAVMDMWTPDTDRITSLVANGHQATTHKLVAKLWTEGYDAPSGSSSTTAQSRFQRGVQSTCSALGQYCAWPALVEGSPAGHASQEGTCKRLPSPSTCKPGCTNVSSRKLPVFKWNHLESVMTTDRPQHNQALF